MRVLGQYPAIGSLNYWRERSYIDLLFTASGMAMEAFNHYDPLEPEKI
jgi:hypothetical protein